MPARRPLPARSAAVSSTAVVSRATGSMSLLIVIRLASEDLVSAVELLEQHHAGELVRQRDAAQREPRVAAVEVESPRPADHEAEVSALTAALLEPSAELDRVELGAVARKQDQMRALGNPGRHPLVLAHLHQLDAGETGEQLAVVLHVVLKGRPQAPHRNHRNSHGRVRYYARARGRRAPLQYPHRPRDDGGSLRELRQRLALG